MKVQTTFRQILSRVVNAKSSSVLFKRCGFSASWRKSSQALLCQAVSQAPSRPSSPGGVAEEIFLVCNRQSVILELIFLPPLGQSFRPLPPFNTNLVVQWRKGMALRFLFNGDFVFFFVDSCKQLKLV